MKNITPTMKLANVYATEITTKCKCGHSMVIPVQVSEKICRHCGKKVKNQSRGYFKYELFKRLNNDRA